MLILEHHHAQQQVNIAGLLQLPEENVPNGLVNAKQPVHITTLNTAVKDISMEKRRGKMGNE